MSASHMSSEEEPLEERLVIGDRSYDISEFKKRHPGGSVISFYNNMDATDVFEAFHTHSERARKWLKSIPSRPVQKGDHVDDSPLVKDFRKLRQDLTDEGFFKPHWQGAVLRFLEVIFIHLLSFWVAFNYSWVLGGILYGLAVARNGLFMHDIGHRSVFADVKKDTTFHSWFFGVLITGCGSFWCNQHNKHHAATQEMHHDTDLATLPIIAFNREIAKYGFAPYMRVQWLAFIPAQLLLFFYWKFTHLRHAIRIQSKSEIAAIVLHHIITIPLFYWGGAGLTGWLVHESIGYALGGCYLAAVFSVNHTHRPVVPAFHKRNWVIRSVEYTTNTTPTPFVVWLSGYLCYQIEHHLFPAIPGSRLHEVAPRVKALLDKHGVKYDLRDMSSAMGDVLENLYDIGVDAYAGKLHGKNWLHTG